MGVTISVELFQDACDVATFILSMGNVYLGGFPANTHGNGGGGDRQVRQATDQKERSVHGSHVGDGRDKMSNCASQKQYKW